MMKTMVFNRPIWKLSLNAALGVCFVVLGATDGISATQTSLYGSYSNVSGTGSTDKTQPVSSGRAYFTTSAENVPGGVKISVELWHGSLNAPVDLWLQAAVNDGKGNVEAVPFLQLSNAVADNPTEYYSKREFTFTYQQLNDALRKVLPTNAHHLVLGPGSPVFVFGFWRNYSHEWGGIGRGGITFLPDAANGGQQQAQVTSGKNRRAADLDVAYPITNMMTYKYNTKVGGKENGLKVGGQVKSRLEKEGKYQIPLKDGAKIQAELYKLANDPNYAATILGPDWTVKTETRYMVKNPDGTLKLDANGMPIPDPNLDGYRDNKDMDAAKNDIGIRYRFTKGNNYGSWNLKPGISRISKDGVVDRLEFAVDTLDDSPEGMKKFADSSDPLNPFQMIRAKVPGAAPSDFLDYALKITDDRHKFKFTHKGGMVVEVSYDAVHAESLRGNKTEARFLQLEMDVDHPATGSANVASVASQWIKNTVNTQFLAQLDGNSFLDGRPVIHEADDLDPSSPVNQKHAADFAIAEDMIVTLRDHTVGKDWIPAPTKGALGAVVLGLVSVKESSPSVKAMIRRNQELKAAGHDPGVLFEDAAPVGGSCRMVFTELHK